MHYRLSVGVSRPKGKSCFVMESKGKELNVKVQKTKSANVKGEILHILEVGLRACKSMVKHEDFLVIEIQNRHLQQWLDGLVEYKDYSEGLDRVFEVLETLDCRYKFSFNANTYALEYLDKNDLTEVITGGSIADMFNSQE